jgi:hypothetical protein
MHAETLVARPYLGKLKAIETKEALDAFLDKLRKDYYGPTKLDRRPLYEALEAWTKTSCGSISNFFAYKDERDDRTRNDGWGKFILYRCSAVDLGSAGVHLLKAQVADYFH